MSSAEAAIPDFLGIGAQKAGTTWLYQMLRQHPDVFFPPIKEIHYFDDVFVPEHRSWIYHAHERHIERLRSVPEFAEYAVRLRKYPRRSPAWYRAVFTHPQAEDKICGEITPAYALLPREGIEAVRATNPTVRLIYIIREPVQRAISHLKMHAARSGRERVGTEMLADKGLKKAVLARSAYATSIPRWEAVLPSAQFLYLPYRALAEQPTSALSEIESFLGLRPHVYSNPKRKVHVTTQIPVDSEVVNELERHLTQDQGYVRERFGVDFV